MQALSSHRQCNPQSGYGKLGLFFSNGSLIYLAMDFPGSISLVAISEQLLSCENMH